MLKYLLIAGLIAGTSVVCSCKGSNGTQSDSVQPEPEEVPPKTDEDGVVVAGIAPDKDQLLKASASGGLAGTEVVFPAGALAVATDVTLAEGAALDLSASKSELGIDPGIEVSAASNTILITVAEAQDPLKPIMVTTTLAEGASLVPQGKKYALLSHVTKAGAAAIMINANVDFKVDGSKITFPITFFGAHAVILVPEGFADTKEAPTSRPLPDKKGGGETPADPQPTPPPASLTVKAMVPAAGAQVALPTSVELTFSENVDAAVAGSAVTVSLGSTPVTGSVSVNGAKVIFSPLQSFLLGQTYTVKVAQTLKGSSGTSLASVYSGNFTVKDGVWATAATRLGTETSGSFSVLAPLNHGKFGFSKTPPSTVIDSYIFDGTVWGAKQTVQGVDVGEFNTVIGAGGVDGRFYVLGIDGTNSHAMRYNPPLSGVKILSDGLTPIPTGMMNFSVAAAGQGVAVYVFQSQGQVYARSLKGDTWGAAESVSMLETYPAPSSTGSVHGNVILTGARTVGQTKVLKVFRRAPDGVWTDLTPNGNELSQDIQSAAVKVSVDRNGNPAVFWCVAPPAEASVCSLSIHNGTAWGDKKTFNTTSTVNYPDFACSESGDSCAVVWSDYVSESYSINAAFFKNGAWNTPSVVGTSGGSPRTQFDRLGRIFILWKEEDGRLRFLRHDGSAWSSAADILASDVYDLNQVVVNHSGAAMVLFQMQVEQAYELYTIQFK